MPVRVMLHWESGASFDLMDDPDNKWVIEDGIIHGRLLNGHWIAIKDWQWVREITEDEMKKKGGF